MSVKYDFSGKRVLITGGSGGLGIATAEKFLAAGATVFVLDVNPEKLQKLKEKHPSVVTIQADLLNWQDCRDKVDQIAPIHHLVNNAGIPGVANFRDMTEPLIDQMFGVNFKPMINMGQAMADGLRRNGIKGGCTIVNVSSILDGRALIGAGLYSCTKAAVKMLTKVMALELADQGIRVNAVRPTVMQTELIPQNTEIQKEVAERVVKYCLNGQISKRVLTVEETADVILNLSAEGNEFVNGSSILVDGGVYTG